MKSIFLKCIFLLSAITIVACKKMVDLDTTPFGKIPYDTYFTDPSVLENAQDLVTPVLVPVGNSEAMRLSNCAGYEQVDLRGRWDEGSKPIAHLRDTYQHIWNSSWINFNEMWGTFYGGIGTANAIIDRLKKVQGSDKLVKKSIADIKVLRAFLFLQALDNFGNVPLDTLYQGDPNLIKTNTRLEVFNFIEKEIKQNLPLLDTKIGPNNRMNKYVAYTLLAQLYLNAEVYTAPTVGTKGTARWADCMSYCDSVILSNRFSLQKNYFENFAWNNNIFLKENILVSVRDRIPNQGNTTMVENLHDSRGYGRVIGVKGAGWNGFSSTADIINLYDNADRRKRMWLIGPQRDAASGEQVINGSVNSGPPTMTATRGVQGGAPLQVNHSILPADIKWGIAGLERQRMVGARNVKYYPRQATSTLDSLNIENRDAENDYVLLRYADVLLMKVEADLRLNGNTVNTASLFQDVRARAYGFTGSYIIPTITLQDIREERYREFMLEGYSRRDNIRFEVADPSIKYWSGARMPLKPFADAGSHLMLYPIPDLQRSLNPRLSKNPGY